MHVFIILLAIGSLLIPSLSRPSQLVEGNDSETGEAEYEANDDTAADDYVRGDQDSTMEEAQRKSGRQGVVLRGTQDQGVDVDSDQHPVQDKESYDSFPENVRRERERHEIQDNTAIVKTFSSEKGNSRKFNRINDGSNVASDALYSNPNNNPNRQSDSESFINGRSVNSDHDYSELLFKTKPAQGINSRQHNNEAEDIKDQSGREKQYFRNIHSRNRNPEGDKSYENVYNYDRNRRHIQNVEETKITNPSNTANVKEETDLTNENSENAIVKNIKKLSEQDLEELLDSLPEDKKALLKKIMDKREITKKAGAVDENSFLEGGQSDTSKLEGGYSGNSNTESSLSSDTPETSKQPESGDVASSKSSDNESGSGGSASKSDLISNTISKDDKQTVRGQSTIESKNDVSISSDSEDISKTENKRETINEEAINENPPLEDSKTSDYHLDVKDSNDFLINQDKPAFDNDDWFDNMNSDTKENPHIESYKREISSSALNDCAKSLEDSFPIANSLENNHLESEMAPLIRVKRTQKDHLKNRDTFLLQNVNPRVESEECISEDNMDFGDYRSLNSATNLLRNSEEVQSKKKALNNDYGRSRSSHLDNKKYEYRPPVSELKNTKFDKMSLGSDTDSVLSGMEGVDDNLMFNSGIREKRNSNVINTDEDRLNRISRTTGPLTMDVSDNSISVSQYQENEAFGPLSKNSEEDVSRFKRV